MLHLDVLRFIASSGIVLHHSKEFFFRDADRLASENQSAGLGLFVELFFVISGYVIARLYANRTDSLADIGRFMQRRIARLVPLHWLTLVCSIAIWTALLNAGVHAEHSPSFRPDCIGATALLIHAGYRCDGRMFNSPSWTISAEMGMYLAFPLIAFVGRKQRWLPLLLGGALLGLILTVLAIGGNLESVPDWAELQPYLRAAPFFLIGVGFWFARDMVRRVPHPQIVLVVATCALLAGMLLHAPVLVLFVLIGVVVIAAIAADLQAHTSRLVRLSAPLGQLTYSMYMWHGLFIFVIMNAIGDKFLRADFVIMTLLAVITYAAIIICSYLSYLFIEDPSRRWIDGLPLFGPKRVRVPTP